MYQPSSLVQFVQLVHPQLVAEPEQIFVLVQVPLWQLDVVQELPSSQELPLLRLVCPHTPLEQLAVVHSLSSLGQLEHPVRFTRLPTTS